MTLPIEPNAVVQLIEQYVDDQVRRASKRGNATLLDEDEIYRLHSVAAEIYALGFYDGTCVANERLVMNEHEMRILGGLDADGLAVVATTFIVSGTENELIPYYDGLAMLEVAKQDFIRRWAIHSTEETES